MNLHTRGHTWTCNQAACKISVLDNQTFAAFSKLIRWAVWTHKPSQSNGFAINGPLENNFDGKKLHFKPRNGEWKWNFQGQPDAMLHYVGVYTGPCFVVYHKMKVIRCDGIYVRYTMIDWEVTTVHQLRVLNKIGKAMYFFESMLRWNCGYHHYVLPDLNN